LDTRVQRHEERLAGGQMQVARHELAGRRRCRGPRRGCAGQAGNHEHHDEHGLHHRGHDAGGGPTVAPYPRAMPYHPMDADEVRAFLAGDPPRTGIVATTRKDGRPHVAPVWYVVDDDGTIVFTTGATTVKGRTLRRTG